MLTTCPPDIIVKAKELLIFYFGKEELHAGGDRYQVDEPARFIGTAPGISGEGPYDVFEVWGHIYKGQYRMRFFYDLADDEYVLMGHEIMEDA